MFLDQKMRNRDLPVTKSLPSYMYTYIRTRTCTVLVPIYSTLPTNLVVTSFVPFIYCKVSTYLQG